MNTEWQIKKCDIEIVRELAYELDIPQFIARLLISR